MALWNKVDGVDPRPGFNMSYLWDLANEINASSWTNKSYYLYHPLDDQSRLTLTYNACVAAVGTGATRYDRHDVYDRLLLWRLPLLALIATTTLPALGWPRKLFTLVHLVADPLDTLWSLMYKLHLAWRQSEWTKTTNAGSYFTFGPAMLGLPLHSLDDDHEGPRRQATTLVSGEDRQTASNRRRDAEDKDMIQYDLDAITRIVNAYQEWHYGDQAKRVLEENFSRSRWANKINLTKFRDRCASAAELIAADRLSRQFPSIVATLQFLVMLTAGFWKTLEEIGKTVNIHDYASVGLDQSPHNIAFGTLWFWLPFAVLATAQVGGPQTKNSIPRILNNLQGNIVDLHKTDERERQLDLALERPEERESRLEVPEPHMTHHRDTSQTQLLQSNQFPKLSYGMHRRWIQGGLPTWQPDKFLDIEARPWFLVGAMCISLAAITIPTVCAMWISGRTPTEGFGCRTLTQLLFFVWWILSHAIDWVFFAIYQLTSDGIASSTEPQEWLFWATFIKDFLMTAGVSVTLTFTAIGVFNNCDCWSKWIPNHGRAYISFPQEQFTFNRIKYRLEIEFPCVVGFCLLCELSIFSFVAWYFRKGHRILKQHDIDNVLEEPSRYKKAWIRTKQRFKKSKSHAVNERELLQTPPL